jgi:hypothetical protein
MTEVIHKGTHGVMGEIHEAGRWDGFRRHDIHIEFKKLGSRIQKLTAIDSPVHRQHGGRISLL